MVVDLKKEKQSIKEKEKSDKFMKRTVKASVFEDLFSNKEYLLQLYQVLHPEDKNATEDDLEYVTLTQVMANDSYNDLGFQVGKRYMILTEAQSTWSKNIIVRCVMYLAQTWKEYFSNTKQSVYASKKLEFPEPEFYVIYTGNKKIDEKTMTLSEEFFEGREIAIDAKVKVIVDGEKGDIINQYVLFTKIVDEQRKIYKSNTKTLIREVIRICKDRNILKKYLESREKEVIDIMVTLYSQEEVLRDYVESEKLDSEIKSAVKSCKDFEKSFLETISYIAKRFHFSQDKAEREVEEYWDEV